MTEDKVGRADYELRADLSGLKKDLADAKSDIAKSGAEAEAATASRSSKWGAALAAGAKTGVKVVATATSGMLAIATKGALELSEAMAGFQAETGATAEEAKRAGKAINDMSGRNMQGLAEITATLTKVHTDLGLTGDEAERTAESFLRFGRATKQDASAAVLAFDDILDAWGLTAADAQSIMDKLVVSHQKYGGSVEGNQAALAAMAPAMAAANMTVDDGIALLNLFAASGIEASGATAMLSRAVKELKPGQDINDLIAELAAIEDPTLRAQRAMELFGKQGALMANAIKPGMTSLDELKASLGDVTGKSDEAAATLDGTFGSWIQLKVKAFGASLRGLGADWGPALTGAASFGTLLGALGLDKALSKAWKGAAGSAAIQGLVKAAAVKATAVYLAATLAGGILSSAVSSAWSKVAGSSAVLAAAGMAGGRVAAAFAAAATTAIIAAPVAVAWFFTQKDANDRTATVAAQQLVIQGMKDEGASVQALRDKWQELQVTAMQLWQASNGRDGLIADVFGTKAQNQKNLADVKALIADVEAQLGRALGEPAGRDIGQGWTAGAVAGAVAGVAAGAPDIAREIAGPTTAALVRAAREAGSPFGTALAAGILSARQAPVDAFTTLKEMLKNAMSPTAEIARLNGQNMSKALRDGLKSGDPAVRAQAEGTVKATADRLGELAAAGGKTGERAMYALNKGIRSKIPAVSAASKAAKDAAVAKLQQAKGPAGDAGEAVGDAFTRRLRAAVAAGDFHINASVGFTIPGHAAGGWVGLRGPEVGVLGEEGPEYILRNDQVRAIAALSRGIGAIPGALAAMSSAAAAPRGMLPSAAPPTAGATVVNNNVYVTGLVRAETPDDIGRTLRRLGALGLAGAKA